METPRSQPSEKAPCAGFRYSASQVQLIREFVCDDCGLLWTKEFFKAVVVAAKAAGDPFTERILSDLLGKNGSKQRVQARHVRGMAVALSERGRLKGLWRVEELEQALWQPAQLGALVREREAELPSLQDIPANGAALGIQGYVARICLVQTLLNPGEWVDVRDFHCSVRLPAPDRSGYVPLDERMPSRANPDKFRTMDERGRRWRRFEDFGARRVALVAGAGMGKSSLLRVLCAEWIGDGERLGVFVELSLIQRRRSLERLVLRELGRLGRAVAGDSFAALARSGRLVLFLDGFDEVAASLVPEVEGTLVDWAAEYPALGMVVSSRPGMGLERLSRDFSLRELPLLTRRDVLRLVGKLVPRSRRKLARQLRRDLCHPARAGLFDDLLCTRLMVTLLVAKYLDGGDLPTKVEDFYDGLLDCVLVRHNKLKPHQERRRKCSFDELAFARALSALCRACRFEHARRSFSKTELCKIAAAALARAGLPAEAVAFVDDLREATGLLVWERHDLRFLVPSVEEYFSAVGLRDDVFGEGGSELVLAQFFRRCGKDQAYERRHRAEFMFLKRLARCAWLRFYIVEPLEPLMRGAEWCEDRQVLPGALVERLASAYFSVSAQAIYPITAELSLDHDGIVSVTAEAEWEPLQALVEEQWDRVQSEQGAEWGDSSLDESSEVAEGGGTLLNWEEAALAGQGYYGGLVELTLKQALTESCRLRPLASRWVMATWRSLVSAYRAAERELGQGRVGGSGPKAQP